MKTNVDRKLIVSLSSDSNTYENGKNIFLDDGIVDVFEDKTSTGGIIKFELDLDEHNTVSVRVDHTGKVRGYGCNCPESVDCSGACKHVVACLFHLADLNDMKGTRIKTDFITDELTLNFKKTFVSGNDFLEKFNSKKFICIEPILNFNPSNKIFLTFKIGIKNDDETLKSFYIIKNIGDFVKNITQHEYFSYGKELGFVHTLNKFDSRSRDLIKILISEKGNIDDSTNIISKNNTLVKTNNFSANKELYISREGLDKFFCVYDTMEITGYNFVQQNIKIKFKGIVKEEQLVLNRSEEEYFVLLGIHFGYVVYNKNICRVEMECGLCLQYLFEAFEKTRNESIQFKKNGINDFLIFILPILSKYNLIDSKYIEEFYQVGYVPLNIKLYLDMNGNNIIGTLEFHYGDIKLIYGEINEYEGFRDRLKEEQLLEMLFYFGFIFEENVFMLKKEDDLFEFYRLGLYSLNELCEVYITDKFKAKQYKHEKVDVSVDIRISGELLKMEINNTHFSTEELFEALKGYKINKKYFRLKNGKFIDMQDEGIKKTMGLLRALKNDVNDGTILVNKNKSYFINELLDNNCFSVNKDDAFNELIDKIMNLKNKEIVFEESLEKILRHYQKEGISWLKSLVGLGFGAILADEMGLGKTLEIIGLIEVDKENDGNPYLIICPTSLIYNWKNEFSRFAENRKIVLIVGTPNERECKIKLIKEDSNTVYITTYDMVKRDILFYENINFRYVVLDEAQNIKNPTTLSAISTKKLKRQNGIALTGTPIENSLKELWSIFDFIIPGYLYELSEFQSLYTSPIMVENDEERTKILRYQILPFILRRFKKDVLLELPDKIETVLYANMTQEQDLAYTAFFKEAKGELLAFEEVNQMNIIRKLTRLRQISCHPQLFIENYYGGSGKLDITLETIKNCIDEGHRILLFSQFTSMLSIIMENLTEHNIDFFYLDGKTKSKDREIMCARFNSGEKEIFLISLKAGGTGLNLTGADVVIHYDPWWNPSVMNQASDRAHRFGQKKVVQVFNIITKDTIEEKIYKLQERKKELIDSVLTDEVQFINNLSKEELINLFLD